MAYDFEESSNQYITFSSNAVYSTKVDCSFWVKVESNPGTHQTFFVSLQDSGLDEPNIRFLWTPAGGGDVYTVAYNGSLNEWKADYTPTVGAWEHWYFSIDWTTNPDTHLFWVNGVSKTMTHNFGNNNEDPDTTGTQVLVIGGSQTNGNDADGSIAEVALWSDNNSTKRLAALAAGYSPLQFPENMTEYVPLVRDLVNRKGGTGTATNSPVVVAHPRIIYPSYGHIRKYTAAAGPAYRSGSSTNFTTANTITLTEPAGAAADDILIAAIYHEGGSGVTITPVAAWNLIPSKTTTDNGETTLAVYWFRRTGSAPSYKFDLSSSTVVQGAVIAVSGAITSGDPQGATATINKSDTGTTITFTGITTNADNSLVIGIAADFAFEARTNVDFANERLDSDADKAIWVGDDGLKVTAGATGNQTITTATSDSWVSVLLAIKPPGSTTSIKTIQGLAIASVKTIQGLAIASVKTVEGLA